jgi:hypothetical protein
MRWPWRRQRRRGHDDDARATRAEAERKLRETRARDPEITALTERMERLRQANRFALMIEDALRRPR